MGRCAEVCHAVIVPTVCQQVFLEDAGFDWKILGPDVSNEEYVAWVCDQDAYACSGQKCSATSMLFMHKNWAAAGESSWQVSTGWLSHLI